MEYPDDPNAHCVSVRRDGVEVARCKFQLYAESQFETVFGPMPEGRLDILALEVASSMRREGIGRSTLDALRREYPSPRFTALNDDATSRAFWDSIGWVRHEPKNPLLARVERVNYSEV
ncbi:MAG TPA: hypothetical protein VN035_14915 [Microbacterium sp.]|nr:hypothetical protein [Microbacterium sp.]